MFLLNLIAYAHLKAFSTDIAIEFSQILNVFKSWNKNVFFPYQSMHMPQENSCIHFHILSWWSGNKIALLSSFNKTVKVTRLLLIQKINELSYSTFMLSRCEVLFSIVVSYSFSRHFVVGEEFFLTRIFIKNFLSRTSAWKIRIQEKTELRVMHDFKLYL